MEFKEIMKEIMGNWFLSTILVLTTIMVIGCLVVETQDFIHYKQFEKHLQQAKHNGVVMTKGETVTIYVNGHAYTYPSCFKQRYDHSCEVNTSDSLAEDMFPLLFLHWLR